MKALEYLQAHKVNIEVVLGKDNKDVLQTNVRLRPWKQDTPTPRMILVMGNTLDEAIDNAAIALYSQEWVKLDWSARTWLQAPQPIVAVEHPANLEFLPPGAQPKPRFPHLVEGSEGKGKKGAPGAS